MKQAFESAPWRLGEALESLEAGNATEQALTTTRALPGGPPTPTASSPAAPPSTAAIPAVTTLAPTTPET